MSYFPLEIEDIFELIEDGHLPSPLDWFDLVTLTEMAEPDYLQSLVCFYGECCTKRPISWSSFIYYMEQKYERYCQSHENKILATFPLESPSLNNNLSQLL